MRIRECFLALVLTLGVPAFAAADVLPPEDSGAPAEDAGGSSGTDAGSGGDSDGGCSATPVGGGSAALGLLGLIAAGALVRRRLA